MTFARYFVRACLGAIGIVFAGLVVVGVTVRLVEQVGQLTEHAGAWTVFAMAVLHGVEQGYEVLPVATFFGVLVVGATWAHRGELLGIGAAGLGPARLTVYALLVATGTSALGAGCGEIAAPAARAALQRIYSEDLGKGLGRIGAFFARRQQWVRSGDWVLHLPEVDAAGKRFVGPQIYRFADGVIVEVIEARELRFVAGQWLLLAGRRHQATRTASFERLELPLGVGAADLLDVSGNPRQMSSAAVSRLIDRRAAAGLDVRAHRVELSGRFAHAGLGLFLLLVAAPWVLGPGRRRSLAATLGGGVVLLSVVLAGAQTLRLLALADRVPAVLGAWGGALCCLGVAPLSWILARHLGHRY